MSARPVFVFAAAFLAVLAAARGAVAQDAVVSPVSGRVEVRPAGAAAFTPLAEAISVASSATVRTGGDGFALVRYGDGSEVVVRPSSEVEVGGGEEAGGLLVRMGKVLLRVRKLLTPGRERTYRTPTTVAAVRGTEFGLVVDASGRTRVFVFEGRVAVTHALLGGPEVEVDAGRMTELDVRRLATEPRPFGPGAFERAGTGEVDRGEDRVVEGGQAPVALRWLAFADPDLDALENPAYLSTGATGLSAVALAEGGTSRAGFQRGGVDQDLVGRDELARGLVQGLGRVAVARGLHLAAFAQGDRGLDRAERATRLPGEAVSTFSRDRTEWTIGEGRLLGAVDRGRVSWGGGLGYRRADHTARSAPAADPAASTHSDEGSDITTLSAGVRVGGPTTFGVAYHHSWIGANTVTDADSADLSQRVDAVEALVRTQRGGTSWGGWLRVERTAAGEDLVDRAGAALYHEDLTIHTLRAGVGAGLAPAPGVLVGVDGAVGAAWEHAHQVQPSGATREDEKDLRVSGSLHAGSQVTVAGPWRLELSVLHAFEHVGRDFRVHPSGTPIVDTRSLFDTRASAGVLYLSGAWALRYAVSAPTEAGRSWTHSLILARSPR